MTKIDQKDLLPDELLEADYGVVHLGRGRHQFIRGLHYIYHDFEPIHTTYDWEYHPSLLNQLNSSESNILSVANNQRILHHFLFGLDKEFAMLDSQNRPKTYFPHRTKTSLHYQYGETQVFLDNVQMEIDLTIEYQGTVGVFEAKNGDQQSFAVYQLFHPFLYYKNAPQANIKEVVCVYLIRRYIKGNMLLDLRAYTFENPLDIRSIIFQKSCRYRLVK